MSDSIDKTIDKIARGVVETGEKTGGRYAWYYIGEAEALELVRDGLNELARHLVDAARQLPEIQALTSALLSAQTALDHVVPGGCWATGPSTGDPVQDLIVCPGCVALAKAEAALAGLLFGRKEQ